MSGSVEKVVTELRQLQTVRTRCRKIFELGCNRQLEHFSVHLENLDTVIDAVHVLMVQDYKDLEVPNHSRWRHFESARTDWLERLGQNWGQIDKVEWLKRHCDLIVVSVLLDAGAGAQWSYSDPITGQVFSRSEGLGVASLRMFEQGLFSSDPRNPHQVDANALASLTLQNLESGFQVSGGNPLVGLSGRLELLKSLGKVLSSKQHYFGASESARPGGFVDGLGTESSRPLKLSALWDIVIFDLQDIWPTVGRTHFHEVCLGDVWHHSKLGAKDDPAALVPFHKLSQWLTYSLLEPFIAAGLQVEEQELLTGLPEYRNGGLFLDYEVLKPQRNEIINSPQNPASECIVEWRALTVILLDLVAEKLRIKLGLSESQLSLARVLEGGTWKAGRKIAAAKRAGGTPPIHVVSDGTVF